MYRQSDCNRLRTLVLKTNYRFGSALMKLFKLSSLLLATMVLLSVVEATPFGYVVNSDDPENYPALHKIDLATGQTTKIGEFDPSFLDVEGLALSPDGELFAVDDATDTFFKFNVLTGEALAVGLPRQNLGITGFGDYGLTFDCTGVIYLSSEITEEFYKIDKNTGISSIIGSRQGLGKKITGLAAWGESLYGVGAMGDENLYRIDPSTGNFSRVGSLGLSFEDAGLAFDETGQLWLVTDRNDAQQGVFRPSRVYKVNKDTGNTSFVSETLVGVEALAIAEPGGCEPRGEQAPIAIPSMSRLGMILLVFFVFFASFLSLKKTRL